MNWIWDFDYDEAKHDSEIIFCTFVINLNISVEQSAMIDQTDAR